MRRTCRFEFDPRRRDLRAIADRRVTRPEIRGFFHAARAGGLRDEITEIKPSPQLREGLVRHRAIHLCPVDLGELVAGIGDARLQGAVIGQQQQAFTVGIETAGGIDGTGTARRKAC